MCDAEIFCDEVKRFAHVQKDAAGKILAVQITTTTLTCLELAGFGRYLTQDFPIAIPGLLACTRKNDVWLGVVVQPVNGVPRWQWVEFRMGPG